jgi:hypothetical protein
VLDDAIHLMMLCDAKTEKPFGILMNWGNHPETLGGKNNYITSDFCHYWLSGIEKGIVYDNEIKRKGVGGIALFMQGAIGGLMTGLRISTYDPWVDQHFQKDSFEKARAQGYRLADLVLNQIEKGVWERIVEPRIALRARTFYFPVQNKFFLLGGALGLFHRGIIRFSKMRSEINLFTLGQAWIMTIPGEINPEIVNGGIEVPEGADYPGNPVEVPPIRKLMKGKYNFVLGLANDEVGYIMPKTHWDTKAPYTYDFKKAPYGEIVSLGPDAGPILHQEIKTLIADMN